MRPIDIYLLVLLPVGLAMVLVLVLFGGRMKPETRRRIERAMAAILYPMLTVFWLWRTWELASGGEWLRAVLMAGVAGLFAWTGVQAFRSGRLAPFARPAP